MSKSPLASGFDFSEFSVATVDSTRLCLFYN